MKAASQEDIGLAKCRVDVLLAEFEYDVAAALAWYREWRQRECLDDLHGTPRERVGR